MLQPLCYLAQRHHTSTLRGIALRTRGYQLKYLL